MNKLVGKCFTKNNVKCDSGTLPSTKGQMFIAQIFSPVDSEVVSNSNFDHRKSIKYGSNVQAVQGIITEYCNDSTVHGFKYIGDRKRPLIERIIWTFALILSIYSCCYLIKAHWEKRIDAGPVIITIHERETPVWEIPFPTVTICPESKTNPSIFNFTDFFSRHNETYYFKNDPTEEELFYLHAMTQMCSSIDFPMYCPERIITSNISEIIRAMTKLSLNNVDITTGWRQLSIDNKYLRKVLTEEGPCYSFNSFDSKTVYREEALVEGTTFADNYDNVSEWSLEKGFNSNYTNRFPFRAIGSGIKHALFTTFLAAPRPEANKFCQGISQGYKLFISTPGDVPLVSDVFISIPLGQQITISIIPEIVWASEGIKKYHPNSRKCYFQHERNLKYFKVYTQANCELECISNFTLEQCGCVEHHMPRDASIPVCCTNNYGSCVDEDRFVLLDSFVPLENKTVTMCMSSCFPTCNTILYRAELGSSTPINAYDSDFWSKFDISFKTKSFKALMRSERYTFLEFIASVGGFLGLFMGVSILSLVELLSFLTIRLWINLRMRRKKRLEMKNLKKTVNDKFSI